MGNESTGNGPKRHPSEDAAEALRQLNADLESADTLDEQARQEKIARYKEELAKAKEAVSGASAGRLERLRQAIGGIKEAAGDNQEKQEIVDELKEDIEGVTQTIESIQSDVSEDVDNILGPVLDPEKRKQAGLTENPDGTGEPAKTKPSDSENSEEAGEGDEEEEGGFFGKVEQMFEKFSSFQNKLAKRFGPVLVKLFDRIRKFQEKNLTGADGKPVFDLASVLEKLSLVRLVIGGDRIDLMNSLKKAKVKVVFYEQSPDGQGEASAEAFEKNAEAERKTINAILEAGDTFEDDPIFYEKLVEAYRQQGGRDPVDFVALKALAEAAAKSKEHPVAVAVNEALAKKNEGKKKEEAAAAVAAKKIPSSPELAANDVVSLGEFSIGVKHSPVGFVLGNQEWKSKDEEVSVTSVDKSDANVVGITFNVKGTEVKQSIAKPAFAGMIREMWESEGAYAMKKMALDVNGDQRVLEFELNNNQTDA